MRILVVGCGSIGARHIRNLRALGLTDVLVVDSDPSRLQEITEEQQVKGMENMGVALGQEPQAVLICTPPHLHVPLALEAVRSGCHCFIEKPVSDRNDGLEELLAEAESRGRKLMVGYNLRFEPGVAQVRDLLAQGVAGRIFYVRAEMGSYLPDWRPWQDYRRSYTAKREMGGGIILDASHELDLVRSLLGEVRSVFCAAGSLGDLEVEVEDTAEITLWFGGGTLGSVHLDMVQRARSRYCKLVGTKGTIILDLTEAVVKWFSVETKEWQVGRYTLDNNQTYVAEMEHFLDCISNDHQPLISGRDGQMALRIALAAKESAATGKIVNLAAA